VNLSITIGPGPPWYYNWQLWTGIATIVVALSAFTLGNFVKYRFDLNIELRKKERAAKDLALALRSELMSINTQFLIATQFCRISFAQQIITHKTEIRDSDHKTNVGENVSEGALGDISINKRTYPRFPSELSLDIYKNNLSQIGLLPPDLSQAVIIKLNALKAMYFFDKFAELKPTEKSIDFYEQVIMDQYNSAIKVSLPLIEELSKFAGVPSPGVEIEHPLALYNTMAASTEKLRSMLPRMYSF
jgi:hypothetical protein